VEEMKTVNNPEKLKARMAWHRKKKENAVKKRNKK
jgi:hypothetical protein